MCEVVLVESMPNGSYESVGIIENELKDNLVYPDLNVHVVTVENKKDFKDVVTSLVDKVSKETNLVLHLCVHGDECGKGIAFKEYETNRTEDCYILWDEFIQIVKPLNEAVGCNLILVLEACNSSTLGENLIGTKFCKYLIAGKGLVYSNELDPLLQFYKTYAVTKDAKSAYNAMANTKYFDVYHNEIQISSIYEYFPNDVSVKEKEK